MQARRIVFRGDCAAAKGMPGAYHANVIIPEQRLASQLGSRSQVDDTGFQIHDAIA
ncbi:hypothetical protein D3C78_1988390 [compost metagenome]